jgi:hypothetical protein
MEMVQTVPSQVPELRWAKACEIRQQDISRDGSAVYGGPAWRRGLCEERIQVVLPPAREQVGMIDECAPQVCRHRIDQQLVLAEVASRGIQERRLVGDAFGDDSVAGFGGDDVDCAHEIFVAIAVLVHRVLVDHSRQKDVIALQ